MCNNPHYLHIPFGTYVVTCIWNTNNYLQHYYQAKLQDLCFTRKNGIKYSTNEQNCKLFLSGSIGKKTPLIYAIGMHKSASVHIRPSNFWKSSNKGHKTFLKLSTIYCYKTVSVSFFPIITDDEHKQTSPHYLKAIYLVLNYNAE